MSISQSMGRPVAPEVAPLCPSWCTDLPGHPFDSSADRDGEQHSTGLRFHAWNFSDPRSKFSVYVNQGELGNQASFPDLIEANWPQLEPHVVVLGEADFTDPTELDTLAYAITRASAELAKLQALAVDEPKGGVA